MINFESVKVYKGGVKISVEVIATPLKRKGETIAASEILPEDRQYKHPNIGAFFLISQP